MLYIVPEMTLSESATKHSALDNSSNFLIVSALGGSDNISCRMVPIYGR